MLEFIGETLFELIVEGAVELSAGKKKVPFVLRILAAFFLFVLFFGLSGMFIISGIKDKEIALVILGVIMFLVFGILILCKWREVSSNKKDG